MTTISESIQHPTRKQLWHYCQYTKQVLNQFESTNQPTAVIIKLAKLSTAEQSILTKGLSFVPTRICLTKQIHQVLNDFQNQLIERAAPFAYDIPIHPLFPFNLHSSNPISENALQSMQQYISNCKTSLEQSKTTHH